MNLQAGGLNGSQFVAHVPKSGMDKPPGCGRLAVSGLGNQNQPLPVKFEAGRVKEVKVLAPFLKFDDNIVFEVVDELSLHPSLNGSKTVAAQQDRTGFRPLDGIVQIDLAGIGDLHRSKVFFQDASQP